jgi:hypothetical protein
MIEYKGSCHCGSIQFSFQREEPINTGLQCNCSICRRRAAIMSDFVLAPEALTRDVTDNALGLYQFDSGTAKHYFCKQCGIYPFHETFRIPGHFRVNLGCIDALDTEQLSVSIFDGKSL